jgi:hypothetical protein
MQPTEIDWAPFEYWLHMEILHIIAGGIAVGIAIWTIKQFIFRGDK